jgi:hypothetical protein
MTEHTNGSLALIFPADGSSAQLVRFDVSKERMMEGVMSSLTTYRIYCYGMGMPSLDDASRIFYIGYVKNSKLPGSIRSNKIASHGFYCLYYSLSLLSIKKTCVKYVGSNSLPNFDAAMSDATGIQLRFTQRASSLSIKRR